jgi:hypothetical protein
MMDPAGRHNRMNGRSVRKRGRRCGGGIQGPRMMVTWRARFRCVRAASARAGPRLGWIADARRSGKFAQENGHSWDLRVATLNPANLNRSGAGAHPE